MWYFSSESEFWFFQHCENYRNFLSRFFGKNFVKATHLLNFVKSLLSRNFCHKVTVWKSRKKHDHDHCFYGKINIFSVRSTFLLKKLLKSWFHGNFWTWSRFTSPHCESVRVNFCNFYTTNGVGYHPHKLVWKLNHEIVTACLDSPWN